MKKRKELNALIGLAADGRRKKPAKKGSGHRLLRTEPPASDSESSSEEDEFAAAGARGRCGKGDYLRCCKFCYPLCAFVILAACVVACVGLVWMQVALKEDLDAIKEKFRTSKYRCDYISSHFLGAVGRALVACLLIRSLKISVLTSTVNHLKNNIKSASDLISLPLTVEKLQKASTVNVAIAKHILCCSELQLALRKNSVSNFESWNNFLEVSSWMFSVVSVESQSERLSKLTCAGFTFQESQSLRAALEDLNNTVVAYQKLNDIKLLNVDSAIGNLSRRVMLLENSPLAVNNLDKRENLSTNVVSVRVSAELSQFCTFALYIQVVLTIRFEILHYSRTVLVVNLLSSNLETNRNCFVTVESSLSTTAKPTDLSRLASRSADDNTEGNGQLRHLSLPGISSIEDLQILFEKATEDGDGKLSYEDLQKLLGSTAQESQSFKKFDTDGDEKYSLQELRLALGV
ncbi:EFC14 protein, partial [Corythaeola cristata]|nr:EFC14 protein [Corythaeola cristata]